VISNAGGTAGSIGRAPTSSGVSRTGHQPLHRLVEGSRP